MARIALVALAVVINAASVRAQSDSLGESFRYEVTNVAAAGQIPRLDSTRLAPKVVREIRIYSGFGLFIPNDVVRIWVDDKGVWGQAGVFWPSRAGDVGAKTVDKIRTEYGCTEIREADGTSLCWVPFPSQHASWKRLLQRLDRLGAERIASPINRPMGRDGWVLIVESRTRDRYRTYWFWSPKESSTDPAERAAAAVGAAVREAFPDAQKR